jgi:transglutaminase-like putative cysteine protease
MRSVSIIFIFLISTFSVFAQQNYDASLIPKELLSHASAVVRDEEENVVVEGMDNTIYRVKQAVTILDIGYDKSFIIKNIKGSVYNEFGKQIGKFSGSDFEDFAREDGFSLFQDVRIKHYSPAVSVYPYTIAYEYDIRLKQSLAFPQWQPMPDYGVSVEKSSFSFSCKPDFVIRYKETNIRTPVTFGNNKDGYKVYTWNIGDLKAIKDEPLSPYFKKYWINVQITPEKFSFYGINGSFTNWSELGKWEYDKLLADRRELPPETIEHVKEITKDITDPKLKAKRIYEYMQGKTHYVSVQVGIGGNQPFLAADVDKQNYGDCKALVNYTQALLKAVDIDSYYCCVTSGGFKVDFLKDFASMEQGDHIILCIPFKNDTTWAECTNQRIPFGFLGDFTDDRVVLACTPEGGKLMHTPKYTEDDNLESRKANFKINDEGELSGNMTTVFKGTDYGDHSNSLINEPPKEQYKTLQKLYPINNLIIDKLAINEDKSPHPVTTEDISLHARDFASLTDGKYYFMLNAANRNTYVPKQVLNRINDVYINRGYTEEDEISYTLPTGYRVEKTPLNVVIEKPFAKFSAIMEIKGNRIIYKRKLVVIDGTYPKDIYEDLVNFYQSVADADDYTVSLVK